MACVPPLELPHCGVIPGDPTACSSPFESLEPFAVPEGTSPTSSMDASMVHLYHLHHILPCVKQQQHWLKSLTTQA